ncbi:MAG: hypothetical protein WB439_05295, partial [Acidobacteriaceae bacterium]
MMSIEEFSSTPSGQESTEQPAADSASWETTQPNYTQPPYTPPPPGYVPPQGAASGLSDSTACALAYITFIPAIIFLLVAPYNQKPAIKFHAIQEIGISVVLMILSFFLIIPSLGWLIYFFGGIGLLVIWVLCIMK